ncbi:MAG TPA: hypothetical protein VIJ94_02675 [Caulobacteraceae bacterium]
MIDIAPFDAPAEAAYAEQRALLEAASAPIGGNDMLIAVQALATDRAVVTVIERDFTKVVGLKVENRLR